MYKVRRKGRFSSDVKTYINKGIRICPRRDITSIYFVFFFFFFVVVKFKKTPDTGSNIYIYIICLCTLFSTLSFFYFHDT